MKKYTVFFAAFFLWLSISQAYAQAWNTAGSAGFSAGAVSWTSITIAPDGTPYVVYEDAANSNKATVMKYNGSSWATVGSPGFSAGEAGWPGIALDAAGTPYVVYTDSVNGGKATVMKYNGSAWQLVGSAGFSAGYAFTATIAIDGTGTPYVAYEDGANGEKATTMKYNGSNWVAVGSPGFSAGAAFWTCITTDTGGTPYVIYADSINEWKATVMKYSSGSWETVGSAGFSDSGTWAPEIAIDGTGSVYAAYADYNYVTGISHKVSVKKYNGSNWVPVGTPDFSAGDADYVSLAIDGNGTPYVAYQDLSPGANNGNATVMKFNGSSWVTVGSTGFSAGNVEYTSIAIDTGGTPYIVYDDIANSEKATVMRFSGSDEVKTTARPASKLSVSPNPTSGAFILHISTVQSETATVIITNMLGEKVKEFTVTTNMDKEVRLDVAPGVYFVSALTSLSMEVKQLVVE